MANATSITIVVPDNTRDLIVRVQTVSETIRARKWERAILTCALWNDERPKHKTSRATDEAVGELIGAADRTVREYLRRIRNHFGENVDKITFGSEVPVPDVPWEAITGGGSATPESVIARAEKDPAYAAEVVASIVAAVPAVVTEAFTPAPKPTNKDRRGGEPMEIAEKIESAGTLWRHTIDQAIAEAEDLDPETADYLRETRRYMKMAEKAITGKRFRI